MTVQKIKVPFWTAWRKYGWTEDVPGIGIKEKIITDNILTGSNIYVELGTDKEKKIYCIEAKKAAELAQKYHSLFIPDKFPVRILVIPLNEFTVYED